MPKPIVLVVEDAAAIRAILRRLLEPQGYDVIEAEDSMFAYGVLSTLRPSVIIVDILMPVVNGIDFIRWLRDEKEHAETPIIAITGHSEEYLTQALAAGATVTARKPQDLLELPKTIKALISNEKNATDAG